MKKSERQKKKRELADKPGSVVAQKEPGQSFIWVIRRRIPQATYPGTARTTHYVPLFGLAPSGVYPAMPVTRHAVRSYRTISPLPADESAGGIFSVALAVGSRLPVITWHSVLWSPDFPPCTHIKDANTARLPGQLPALI